VPLSRLLLQGFVNNRFNIVWQNIGAGTYVIPCLNHADCVITTSGVFSCFLKGNPSTPGRAGVFVPGSLDLPHWCCSTPKPVQKGKRKKKKISRQWKATPHINQGKGATCAAAHPNLCRREIAACGELTHSRQRSGCCWRSSYVCVRVCMCVCVYVCIHTVCELTCELTGKLTGELTGRWLNMWVNRWVDRRVNMWVNMWVNRWINRWVSRYLLIHLRGSFSLVNVKSGLLCLQSSVFPLFD